MLNSGRFSETFLSSKRGALDITVWGRSLLTLLELLLRAGTVLQAVTLSRWKTARPCLYESGLLPWRWTSKQTKPRR